VLRGAEPGFCSDAELSAAGFGALSTVGFFSDRLSTLRADVDGEGVFGQRHGAERATVPLRSPASPRWRSSTPASTTASSPTR